MFFEGKKFFLIRKEISKLGKMNPKNGGPNLLSDYFNLKFLRLRIRLLGQKKKSVHQKNVEQKLEKNRLQKAQIITQRRTSKIRIRTKRPFKN